MLNCRIQQQPHTNNNNNNNIFNLSFQTSCLPQIWRNAIIIPLLKAGKPGNTITSYRPISLTSCVSKTFERMLADRLYYHAEINGLFNPQQAGFRKGRGCEDQIARIVQAIHDGFQQKPMKRSVLVLLDFSKAYDTVWRERLLLSLIKKGIPSLYVKWLYRFLENRQGKVRCNGTMGCSNRLKQGLPQGSVLSPILFLFYINNLADILPCDNVNAMFADDVSILATRDTKEDAREAAQASVNVVTEWAGDWKLSLNANKSECSFFSTWAKEGNWTPEIVIDGETIKHEPNPRFLGVTLDRQLGFGPHVAKIVESAGQKLRMLSALANTEWGWRKEQLMRVYTAYLRSNIEYAGFAWQSCASKTHIETLERLNNKALRIITGQYKSSPVESLRAEVGSNSIKTRIKINAVIAAEKCLRLPPDHPRRIAFEGSVPQRTTRQNWRSSVKTMTATFPDALQQRIPLQYFSLPPWSQANLEVRPTLNGISGNDTEETKLEALAACIEEVAPRYTLYTDGSATAGKSGGVAVVVTDGNPATPNVLETIQKKGASLTCAFDEEVAALETAAEWIAANPNAKTIICTDSQHLCLALTNFHARTDRIRSLLSLDSGITIIQWIPGHSNIPGNDLADRASRTAAELAAPSRGISFRGACTTTRQHITETPAVERVQQVYSQFTKVREREISSRSDQVNLARIRSGHHTSFQEYQHRLDETKDPTCPLCHEEDHSLEHWFLRCRGVTATKKEIFGKDGLGGLDLLTEHPQKSVTLARITLLGAQQ